MNERIRELWAQCVIKHSKTPMNWQDVADEFAELIVRECINQVSDLMDYTEYTDSHFNAVELKALRDARRVIQEHFGVEELHTCPYRTEIHNNYELCDCTPDQVYECAMDI